MATEVKLVAQKREKLGTRESRRLRRQGLVPGNVYGHRQPPVAIVVPQEAFDPILLGGQKVVDVEIDGNVEMAMIRDVQWDTFGMRIQHFDLVRISADERVVVEVPVEFRGTAPGAEAGGVLEQPLRTLTIECLAYQIPDSVAVRVGGLEIGDAVHVRDVELPPHTLIQNPPDAVVVQISRPTGAAEEPEAAPAAIEPEVIGKERAEEKS